MKRKVNRVGQSTLTVSLPSKWAEKYKIKPGDEIEVVEEGNQLKLFTEKGVTFDEFHIKVDKTTHSHLKSVISNAYKKGYDKVLLEYEDESVLKDIQAVVDTLLGIEIVKRTKNGCEIRNVAKELETEFDDLLKSTFILVMEMGDDVLADILKKGFNRQEDIAYKRETVTKHSDFCKRVLNKHKRNDSSVIFEYLIVWNLEKISNEYNYIYRYCAKYRPKRFSREMLAFFGDVNALLHMFYQALYEKNLKKIGEVGKMKDRMLYSDFYDMQKKFTSDEQPIVHHLAIIARRLWNMCGPFHGMHL